MSFKLTDHHKQVLADGMLHDMPPAMREEFFVICDNFGLDPFRKQIYGRAQDTKNGLSLVSIVGIDGFRVIAQRTGQYRGQTPTEWCGTDGVWTSVWLPSEPPAASRVGIIREGFDDPLYATALWKECAGGSPFWKSRGPSMLAKCAEAVAFRKAFPNEMGGLYIDEELREIHQPEKQKPPTKGSTADKVKDLLKSSGHEIRSGSEIKTPEPSAVDPEIATFNEEEVTDWLMPLVDELGLTLNDLREAMGKDETLNKAVITSDPTGWPCDWKPRIDGWAKAIKAKKENSNGE